MMPHFGTQVYLSHLQGLRSNRYHLCILDHAACYHDAFTAED